MNMLAQRVHRFGSPDVIMLETIAVPRPLAGEALVRIAAAGVGPWDALVRSGKSAVPQPLPLTLGADFSGTILEAGTGVDHLAAGLEVFGVTNARFIGAYAEYAVVGADRLAPKPRTLSFTEAASVPVAAVTAWRMVHDEGGVRPGMNVVVHGASGAVGGLAVQLAHRAGAQVTAFGASGDAERLHRLGADRVDAYAASFETQAGRADLVVDTIGGEIQERSFALLRTGGLLISSVEPPSVELAAQAGVRTRFFIVDVRSPDLQRIGACFERGELMADVGAVLPLEEARDAHRLLAETVPIHRGKIVLDTGPERYA